MIFSSLPPALPQVRAGKLRAIGVTSLRRSAAAPEVPTIAEAGVPGYEALGWWGIVVPGKTPVTTVAALSATLARVLKSDEAKAQLFKEGIEAVGSTPEIFAAHLRTEQQKWAKVIKEGKLKIE